MQRYEEHISVVSLSADMSTLVSVQMDYRVHFKILHGLGIIDSCSWWPHRCFSTENVPVAAAVIVQPPVFLVWSKELGTNINPMFVLYIYSHCFAFFRICIDKAWFFPLGFSMAYYLLELCPYFYMFLRMVYLFGYFLQIPTVWFDI